MRVVIDANIIFSALIKGNPIYLSLIRNLEVYAPDFIFLELGKYEERILNKTSSKEKMRKIIYEIFKGIHIIPKMAVKKSSMETAYNLCKEIDEKDVPYVALTIELDAYLWTNDKKLTEKLIEKGFKKILTTDEIIKILDRI